MEKSKTSDSPTSGVLIIFTRLFFFENNVQAKIKTQVQCINPRRVFAEMKTTRKEMACRPTNSAEFLRYAFWHFSTWSKYFARSIRPLDTSNGPPLRSISAPKNDFLSPPSRHSSLRVLGPCKSSHFSSISADCLPFPIVLPFSEEDKQCLSLLLIQLKCSS